MIMLTIRAMRRRGSSWCCELNKFVYEKKERVMLMLVEQVMCFVLYVRREKNKD